MKPLLRIEYEASVAWRVNSPGREGWTKLPDIMPGVRKEVRSTKPTHFYSIGPVNAVNTSTPSTDLKNRAAVSSRRAVQDKKRPGQSPGRWN